MEIENTNELIKERLNKLEAIKSKNIEPYGRRFPHAPIKEFIDNFSEGREAVVAGRIMAVRNHGKSTFLDIKDASGKVQAYFKEDLIGADQYELLSKLDIGDIIGLKGGIFKTRTGEPTIKTESFTILSKSLRPLPEKWHGLKDVETRYRQRYVDLIVNEDVKNVFFKRSQIIKNIRNFLDQKGYMEVETPMMHPIAGGAAGKPFKTHHEALDMDLFLRIAPELYLKKLLVGGFEKVYELNRSFRNEGISIRHNPEFTMLEVYTAYADCEDMIRLTEELITNTAKEVFGKLQFEFQGKAIDLSIWKKVSFTDLMKDKFGILPEDEPADWTKKLKKHGVDIEGKELSKNQLINIIAELIEPKAEAHPVFVTEMFSELCPLAKNKPGNPKISERFELFMGGMEVANAYSELNDPIEQHERFSADAGGKPDKIDMDFVRALEYGMPPAGGLGIGIDRIAMVLTGADSIRDVILFPQMKKES